MVDLKMDEIDPMVVSKSFMNSAFHINPTVVLTRLNIMLLGIPIFVSNWVKVVASVTLASKLCKLLAQSFKIHAILNYS